MHYLTGWRMRSARAQLQQSSDTLTVLADRLGYKSEAAFCRAFKECMAFRRDVFVKLI